MENGTILFTAPNKVEMSKLFMPKSYGIVLVILGHILRVGPNHVIKLQWAQVISDFIYMFHMNLFFVIAGIVFFLKIDYYLLYPKEFFIKQGLRFALPFVTINLLYTISFYICIRLFNLHILTGGHRYNTIFLCIGGSWFLCAMLFAKIFSYVVFKISSIYFKTNVYRYIAFILLFWIGLYFIKTPVLVNFFKQFPFDWHLEGRLFWFNLSFIIVVFVNINRIKFNVYHLVLLLLLLVISYKYTSHTMAFRYIYIMLVITLILMISHFKNKYSDQFILWVAKLGMPIYLLHFFVIDFIWQPVYNQFISQKWFGNGYTYFAIAFIFVSAITLAISNITSNIPIINLILFGDKTQMKTVK
ncbi:acyltransferase family protein [Candidatus Magnetobacterium casense]|uniref:Acyltransferase 3 domain-containing protein n=1 Tax=Candidatus Magnetobacterium casense TaxID=1455061 RepID=A0ABS6RY91_9BACT|nr:acyltransferase family protein [Candidatus Magnetobacterium casensis]MBV6341546.1 hypothetical protein [Candidatus Magnetobacterium casensis]